MMGVYTRSTIKPEMLERFKLLASDGKVAAGDREADSRRRGTEGSTSGDDKAPGHHDGWGIGFYNGLNEPEYAGRFANSAAMDTVHYDAAVKKAAASTSRIALAHVRKCSVGNKSVENTHPFFEGDWMFCHNGTIDNFHGRPPIEPKGTTDSERFFKFLANDIRKGAEPAEAAGSLLAEVTRRYKYTSITFLLTNGRKLYGFRMANPDLGKENEDYYTIHAARDGDAIILGQEPLWGLQWREVPNKHYIVVDPKLTVDLRPIPHVGE